MQDLKHIPLRAQQRQQDFDDTTEFLACIGAIILVLSLPWIIDALEWVVRWLS